MIQASRTVNGWQGVLLDLDGTLLDTLPDLAASANEVRAALDMPLLDESLVRTFVGKGADNLIKRTLAGSLEAPDPEPELFGRAKTVFFEHYRATNGDRSVLYPGVVEGLERLADLGIPMAVVTNKPYDFSVPLLERTNLMRFMQAVVGGDTCAKRKPDPEPILHACARLSCQPTATLTIGDSINDALAAKAAGCGVVAVPYGYNEGNPVTELPVDGIVESVLEAVYWLQVNRPSQ
ncbi:MAG: phosphoglycolate phosphatase [Burkholderiaceae bacterium]|nr:phosphoglycolate phosphatase [Burkholderiaceae bacterium]MCD8517147.1 phosphoglycolate phosphatase [Burkholderiaceae bacterium]MCD8536570.1 phosphoglycolate phosphatase [Burkholderiaceae bacterium]MCD8565307.1 phosphoglycolate phosphatase [Burkholderiaceae bacterium]